MTNYQQIEFVSSLIDNAPSTEILESIMEQKLLFNIMNNDKKTAKIFGMKILLKMKELIQNS